MILQPIPPRVKRNKNPEKLKSETLCITGNPNGVAANMLTCDLRLSKFEPKSRYYVRFRANILGKDMGSLISLLWAN